VKILAPLFAEASSQAGGKGVSVTLDIAALLWPLAVAAILVLYRKEIPELLKSLLKKVSKFEVGGISIELAATKAFVPNFSAGALDLRKEGQSTKVNDSTAKNFLSQLREGGSGDHAVADLGGGDHWLTSRLYIMAIVYSRMKGIKAFVFVETAGHSAVRKRFVCWAESDAIRWALARRFPWLEEAYAQAYWNLLSQLLPTKRVVVSNDGRLGLDSSPDDVGPSLDLVTEFLRLIQTSPTPPPPFPPGALPGSFPSEPEEWILVDAAANTYEAGRWINGDLLESLLGADARMSYVRSSELRSKSPNKQLRIVLSFDGHFVPTTDDDRRFEHLLNRSAILEQVAKQLPARSENEE
jgi:hypothetical protein